MSCANTRAAAVTSACDERTKAPSRRFQTRVEIRGCEQGDDRRPIDYIMLSVGGNDIGFAALVAEEALRRGTLDYDLLRGVLEDLLGAIEDGKTAADRLDYLQDIYFHLNDAFKATLPVRDQDLSRVLLAAYPLPDQWRGNGLCGDNLDGSRRADESMDGVDVFGGFAGQGAAAKKATVEDVHAAACKLDVRRSAWMNGTLDPDKQSSETWMAGGPCAGAGGGVVGPAPTLPWSYVTGFVEKAWPHGYLRGRWRRRAGVRQRSGFGALRRGNSQAPRLCRQVRRDAVDALLGRRVSALSFPRAVVSHFQ